MFLQRGTGLTSHSKQPWEGQQTPGNTEKPCQNPSQDGFQGAPRQGLRCNVTKIPSAEELQEMVTNSIMRNAWNACDAPALQLPHNPCSQINSSFLCSRFKSEFLRQKHSVPPLLNSSATFPASHGKGIWTTSAETMVKFTQELRECQQLPA